MSAAPDAPSGLPADILGALALGAVPRSRDWVADALASPALRTPGTLPPGREAVRRAFAGLRAAGLVEEAPRRPGSWIVAPEAYARVYGRLLDRVPHDDLRAALAHADGYSTLPVAARGPGLLPSLGAGIARVRLDAFSGVSAAAIAETVGRIPLGMSDVSVVMDHAVSACLHDGLFDRLNPDWQLGLLAQALDRLGEVLDTGSPLTPAFVRGKAVELLRSRAGASTFGLRHSLACDRLSADPAPLRDERWPAALAELLEPGLRDDAPAAPDGPPLAVRLARAQALHAAALAVCGRWDGVDAALEAALAALRKATGRRRGLLPEAVMLPCVLALLAQQTPSALEKALKLALAEGGRREPALDTPWGAIALAIQMRLGIVPRAPGPFVPYGSQWGGLRAAGAIPVSPLDFNRWLMRAWLKEGAEQEALPAAEAAAAERLGAALAAAGLAGRREQLDAALAVLAGEPAPAWFFVPPAKERWQIALDALRVATGPSPSAQAADTRIAWVVEDGPHGAIRAIVPHEQKRGARGWGQPKEVSLARLQRGARTLSQADVAVVAAIRTESFGRGLRLDLAQAAAALVGHPHVAFADAPDVFVELVEGAPELEVLDEGERLRVRLHPAPAVANDAAVARWAGSEAERKEQDALRLVSIWRDGPQRARLVRLDESRKRVAQLLGTEGLEVPRRGAAQLQEVLAGLGSHFRIHADDAQTAQAARELPAEARLRAELQPLGDGLLLRLVAAPFGAEHAAHGPRLIPGRGRARVVATLDGERLGVQRDLAREREHLESVLDACPMLVPLAPDAPCEWQLDAPDDALALLERLQPHHAIAALDWPQGRPVRVLPGALDGLVLKVRTHADWLGLQGELKVDEQLVVSLQQLIGFAAAGRSRFVPLGDGRYLALSQALRERVADIAAVVEAQAARLDSVEEMRLPTVAAPWLQAASEGLRVEHDAAYAARLMALDDARRIVPKLPSTLQAELRPYQEEGFEWAMRLAAAGLGACLADDMGLGKTLQAIAVLLARAAEGPALVVMPTSLVGNWRSECARFAPTLRVHVYAEQGAAGARAKAIARMGRRDVLLVSYPMLQLDEAAFAARSWATLVLDEAQAIKNAAAKRSQAVFALQAAFRLAMSGTPIENRLGELWSVMRACNPGLLGSQARFNERFANLIERQHDRAAQRTLKRLIAPFVLRRTKAQVLAELPPRTELVLRVEGDEAEQAHYEALRREALVAAEKSLAGDGAGQAHLNILAGLTRLRRAACDPRLVTPGLRPGAKVAAFAELAAELVANGHKALVFSQFVDFLALLREPLDAAGIAYQTLDGSTPAAERTRRVEAFQAGEGDLFLISLKAGGFGLNLTVADYVVIADPWWNPAAEDQASGRAHRIGQRRPVTVYRMVHAGTLEERILDLHQAKRELAEGMLEADGDPRAAVPLARELLQLMRGDEPPDA
jgi:superfamily II DNA or RNA helicase